MKNCYEYIKAADEMEALSFKKLTNLENICEYVGNGIIAEANEGERSYTLCFAEFQPDIRNNLFDNLNPLIGILKGQGYDYEIKDNSLIIYW